jgi:hypothetical protein
MTGPPSGYYSVTKEYCIQGASSTSRQATRREAGSVESSPALRFVVSCVYAVGGAYTQKPVYTRGGTYSHPLCIHTTARVYAPTCVYAPGCVYTPAAYTHPALAYSHLPRVYAPLHAYTHPPRIRTPACVYTPTCVYAPWGVRIYAIGIRTYPRIRTHTRVQASVRERGVGCVYTPTCVYAPDAAYTQGRDERHAGAATVVYGL